MGWSGRAPAPPASEAGKGRQRQGARHVSDTQYRDRRNRHRYRQELVPRRGPRYARRHRAAAKVVAWPSGGAARQYTALPDRHGSLRRRPSPEPQTRITWSRRQVNAGQISRRGNRYLRVLFVQAAWVVLVRVKRWERYGLKSWIEATKKRLHHNVLAIALANKLARIAWAVLAKGRAFELTRPDDASVRPA